MKKAFTLIELLIVIAIIAILALIAVPNFLEAQVRAKVTRVYADMRTVAVAVEAYTVDWGRAPVCCYEYKYCTEIEGKGLWGLERDRLKTLTTPVSFIANIPLDPFCARGGFTNPNGTQGDTRKTYAFTYVRMCNSESDNSWGNQALRKGVMWHLSSYGPSRTRTRLGEPGWISPLGAFLGKKDCVYDSSNGTMSHGLIVRTNQGQLVRQGN